MLGFMGFGVRVWWFWGPGITIRKQLASCILHESFHAVVRTASADAFPQNAGPTCTRRHAIDEKKYEALAAEEEETLGVWGFGEPSMQDSKTLAVSGFKSGTRASGAPVRNTPSAPKP